VRDSRGLAIEARILADDVVEDIVGIAEREALSLKAQAQIETGASKAKKVEEKKEEPKVEAKVEEKPVEEKKEETEAKIEDKKEEPKVEEKPVEVKPEEPKKEESKPEAPKEEKQEEPEAPKEAKPAEAKVEEPKPQEEPKPEPQAPKPTEEVEQTPSSENEEEAVQPTAHIKLGESTEQVPEIEEETPVGMKDKDALPQVLDTAKSKEPTHAPEQEEQLPQKELSGIKAAIKKIEDLFSITVEDAKRLKVTKNDEELAQKALEDLKKIDAQIHKDEPEVEELKAHIARLRAIIEARRVQPDTQKVEQLVVELQKKGTLRPEAPKKPERVPTAHELLEQKKQKEDHKGDANK